MPDAMTSGILRLRPLLAAILLAAAGTFALAAADDAQLIATAMKAEFDRPDHPLRVDPVAVEGGFAVAGWRQGDTGGRALLQRNAGQWQIVLCGGDSMLQPAILAGAGMTAEAAQRLLVRTRTAEAKLAPEHRAALAKFTGLTRLQHGHH